MWLTLRKKCPYSELFWSAFSWIRTEYGKIRIISPYWVQMRENTDHNNSEYGHFSRSLTFLCFRMANKNFAYYYKDLNCWSGTLKSWNVHFHLALDWNNVAWPIWWLKQWIKPSKLNESIIAITNTSYVYLLRCVWVFCFLRVQKLNLSPTLALN